MQEVNTFVALTAFISLFCGYRSTKVNNIKFFQRLELIFGFLKDVKPTPAFY